MQILHQTFIVTVATPCINDGQEIAIASDFMADHIRSYNLVHNARVTVIEIDRQHDEENKTNFDFTQHKTIHTTFKGQRRITNIVHEIQQ